MDPASVLSAINTSVSLLTKLGELTKTLNHVEIKTTLAQLAGELADAKLRMADLTIEIAALKTENAKLKEAAESWQESEEEREFKAGDVVRLKGGGPIMTISQVAEEWLAQKGELSAWCQWVENGESRVEIYKLPQLTHVRKCSPL